MMRDKEIEETETGIQCQNITKRVSWHSSLELRATPGRSSPCALGLCDKILPALLLHLPSVLVCGQTYLPLADLRPRLTDLLARSLGLAHIRFGLLGCSWLRAQDGRSREARIVTVLLQGNRLVDERDLGSLSRAHLLLQRGCRRCVGQGACASFALEAESSGLGVVIG
jgi:hypothetical protein